MPRTDTLTIGGLAAAAGVHIETIRYYERRGLLSPAGRTSAGYRQFDADDVWRLAFIRRALSSASRWMRYVLCWRFQRTMSKAHAPRCARSRQVTSGKFGRKSPICGLWSVSERMPFGAALPVSPHGGSARLTEARKRNHVLQLIGPHDRSRTG